jgi:steroid 5-alpha reductase family enzyme
LFLGQAVWVSTCLLPVLVVNAIPAAAFAALPAVTGLDALGLLIWLAGFTTEVTADSQRMKWVAEKKAKVHDEEFMTRGLFSRR